MYVGKVSLVRGRERGSQPVPAPIRGARSLALAVVLLVVAVGCRSAGTTPEESDEREQQVAAEPAEVDRSESEVEPAGEEPEPLKNTLRWKTASEVDNFGFDVYRGLAEEGPFERLTAEPIPGAVTTDEPQSYVFEDDTIEAGVVYWYYVESISLAGVREKFTPVFAAKAKGVPAQDGE